MKTEIVGTFHIGIWPEPEPDPDPDDYEGCNHNYSVPTVITKPLMDKAEGVDHLASSEHDLPPLPERVRELVALRRKQFG